MARQKTDEYAALIGLDWADQKHDYYLGLVGRNTGESGLIGSRPEEVAAWINQLRKRFKGQRVALCLEQSKGALIHQLMAVEFIDLYPINPQALAHFRKAFAVSGAKDDPTDAQLLWEYLLKHRDRLRVWTPEDVDTRLLALLVQDRRKLLDLRTKLSNKLTATLKGYFPQALELIGTKVASPMACDFLQRWTSLAAIKKCRTHTIQTFYTQHQVRNQGKVEARIARIRASVPLVEDAAIVETSVLKVKSLSRQIACLNDDLDEYEQYIAALFETHPENDLFEALPGAGAALAPRLLVAMGTDRTRFAAADEVATFAGIAPVTERSGQHTWVHWRLACAKFLRQSFHEFANMSRHQSVWAHAYYEGQRARGKAHHAALRALAFKWIRIIYRCWKQHEIYNESTYLAALVKSKSPLVKLMAEAA
ncbi:MAG: IS110 family transposase [Candidatus Latescibacteria bacterium]|nr:IS110 family transposase [Candidatus Latescibacterota bacterium]